jgi:hypothetical protein
MIDGFHSSRALNGALASPLPVRVGLRTQARLGVVIRQHLRLSLASLGKALLQHLGNPLMVALASTL